MKVILLTAWDLLVDDQQCIGTTVLTDSSPKPLGISTILEALHEVGTPVRYQRVPRASA